MALIFFIFEANAKALSKEQYLSVEQNLKKMWMLFYLNLFTSYGKIELNDHVDYDLFRSNNTINMPMVLECVMTSEPAAHILCFFIQFAALHKLLASKKKKWHVCTSNDVLKSEGEIDRKNIELQSAFKIEGLLLSYNTTAGGTVINSCKASGRILVIEMVTHSCRSGAS